MSTAGFGGEGVKSFSRLSCLRLLVEANIGDVGEVDASGSSRRPDIERRVISDHLGQDV